MVTTVWVVLLQVIVVGLACTCRASEESLVSRIAFGSCANQSAPQPIWNAIKEFDPQLFIWLGDNIYGDTRLPLKIFGKERTIGPWKNAPRFIPVSEEELQSRYKKAKNNAGYTRLREKTQVIGTWDDHDYGLNDAGKEFRGKNTSQRLLLDFLDEPHDSPRRKQAGVYASYTFGPKNKQVKVILLDTRYHRDPLNSDGCILGSSQWLWLEKELNSPKSALTIIGSSIQLLMKQLTGRVKLLRVVTCKNKGQASCTEVFHGNGQLVWQKKPLRTTTLHELTTSIFRIGNVIARGHEVISNISATTGPLFYLESWGRFPKERNRLLKLISDSRRDGVLFISGDVHFGEVTRHECAVDYPLYDITSSGLTQAVEKAVPSSLHFLVRVVAWLTPTTMRIMSPDCRYRSCTYGQPNFGSIEIDWGANPVNLKVEVRDVNGDAVIGVNISLSELQTINVNTVVAMKAGEIRRHCSLEVNLPWLIRRRLAFLFFGALAFLLLALVFLFHAAISVSRHFLHKCKLD